VRALSLDAADLAALSAGVLSRGGALRFRARGASMALAIRNGDTLTVAPVEAAALRVGDVVLYRTGEDRLAAHRIVARRLEGDRLRWVARGDAAMGLGDVVEAEQVLGRVVRVQRGELAMDLERGVWLWAARLWVATAPLGPLLLRGAGVLLYGAGRIKRLGARLLHRLQRHG
jgi:hypothetical protein